MPVTAPADKRFLRAHVRPVRRHAVWRTTIRLARTAAVAGLVALAAYRAGAMLMASSVLRIDRITIRGTERLSNGGVLALVDGLRGQNILRADLDQARRHLLESPWVADAVLRTRLPASVDVAITERRPIGIARLPGGQLFLIDEHGTVIDQFGPKYAEFDLPMIDGLTPPGRLQIDRQRVDLASRVVASLAARSDLARRVSQIDVSDAGDAVVLLDADSALLRLGDRDFVERLGGYVDLAPALRERVASIDYVDLRYGSHVFVGTSGKRAAGTAVPATGGR
jgi:cell division protein FtsQ